MVPPKRRALVSLIFLGACAVAACSYYDASAPDDQSPPTSSIDGGGSGQPVGDLPCDVAEVLSASCWSCHSDPPRNGAPVALTNRASLAATSPSFPGVSIGERALIRMSDAARPMPPGGLPGPSDAELASYRTWIEAGMPEGSCGGGSDGDGGVTPQPTTCTSGDFWPEQWDEESPNMNPGLPCRACHLQEEDELAFFFMGTVFPMLHEQDRCFSNVPTGTEVHIIDRDGALALRLPVRRLGNFFSQSRAPGVLLPFTARVVTPDGLTIGMSTPQMTGDCNGCHTEQGTNGAPGRILIPTAPAK